ncbi:MAG: NnrS family protein, partial [Hyphomicrobiales bacterium]
MATGNDRAQGKPASGFLSRGFRPFFLGAACLAAMAVPLWALALSGAIALPGDFASPAWHVHEMIFGYTGAVLAGFSLTAVPNWTGRLPVAGRPLGALFALWLIGRAAMLAAPGIGPVAAGVIDALFPLVLAGYLLREIIAAGNMRNLPIAGLFTLFALANVFWHVAGVVGWDSDLAQRLGLAVVTV